MFDPRDARHGHHMTREVHPKAMRGSVVMGQQRSAQPAKPKTRYCSGQLGFDRCCGGGLVKGSWVLFTGDPGAGKSTLMLLVLHALAELGLKVLYVSGEETADAIEMRFTSLGLKIVPTLHLLAPCNAWETVAAEVMRIQPAVTLVDSLDRVGLSSLGQYPLGSDMQKEAVMRAAEKIVKFAPWKPTLALIGHVNAEGNAAGRKAVVHDVDLHLHFSKGENGIRTLRTRKNRHGADDEIALYRFRGPRIAEVGDLSRELLSGAMGEVGAVAYPALRFARPVVLPIEASVSAKKGPSEPRVRRVTGMPDRFLEDAADLLSDAAGITLTDRSVRLKAPTVADESLSEDGCLLATCLAIVSAAERLRFPSIAAFGTVSPSGKVQGDHQAPERLDALRRAGVKVVVGPRLDDGLPPPPSGVAYHAVTDLRELVNWARKNGVFAPTDPDAVTATEAARAIAAHTAAQDLASGPGKTDPLTGADASISSR